LEQPANATLAAIAVIQEQILVLGATSLNPMTVAAIDTIIAESVVIIPLLTDIQVSMTEAALDQANYARKNQFIFMGIILGLIVLDILFVYFPVERRINHMVHSLMSHNAQLALLADQLSIVTDFSPNGIFRTDTNGRLVFVNSRWREITGLGDGLDQWMDNVSPASRTQVEQQWQAVLTEPMNHISTEFLFVRPDQREVWIHGQARPEVDERVCIRGMIGAFSDVTERKRLEQEKMDALALAASQAQEHVREQARYVDIVCHEIRNPLNGIINNADVLREAHETVREILRRQPPSADTEEMLRQLDETTDLWDAIDLCVSHQRRVTDDVLQVSRLREGRFSLLSVPFSPQRLIDAIVHMFRAEADTGGVALSCAYAPTVLAVPRVLADPQRISQILINLVSNAVKFTKPQPGVRNVDIEVDVEPPTPRVGEPMCLVVHVRDTGIGMSAEQQARLFVPFGQADTRTYSRYGGSGMGLFISRALLDVMGGRVVLDSEPGRGSTFTVVIPCERLPDDTPIEVEVQGLTPPGAARPERARPRSAPAAPPLPSQLSPQPQLPLPAPLAPPRPSPQVPPPPPPQPSAPATEPQSPPVPAQPPPQRRVLVVEDNDINQRVLRRQLETAPEKPYVVDVAGDGEQAVDATEHTNYDVIIMDVEMPVMGGLEATTRIREREREQGRPPAVIIGLSGNAREEHVRAGLDSGMDDYLVKPCQRPTLLGCISKHLHLGSQVFSAGLEETT